MFQKINILVYLILPFLYGCADDDARSLPNDISDQTEETKTFSFLALGDSYTIGQGVTEDESWPFQLKDTFSSPTRTIDQLTIIARTGWTTGNLINAIAENNPENHDLVSLLIGVNNQFQQGDFMTFQSEFDLLLEKSIALARNKKDCVLVVSIPDYGVTPFGSSNSEVIASEIDRYNAYIKQQCDQLQIAFVDVTSISRTLGDSEGALATDDLHPSGSQYGLWVEKITPIVKDILN